MSCEARGEVRDVMEFGTCSCSRSHLASGVLLRMTTPTFGVKDQRREFASATEYQVVRN